MVHALSTIDRFWSKVNKTESCWLWTASKSDNGYGKFDIDGRRLMAHRVAYMFEVGPIPDGFQIDHLCRVRDCVRPDHLEAVTQYVNNMRSESVSAQAARQTQCIHGHDFTTANTYVTPDGRRQCRTCIADRLARHQRRRHIA